MTAQIESAIWLVVRGSGIIIHPYGTMVPILCAAVIVIPDYSYSFFAHYGGFNRNKEEKNTDQGLKLNVPSIS